eukprot:CAMPEP_0117763150 /NCGR_PEP_ID=MMETSP0947-20121206/18440_1 /TAXON_ID=44440 /ORGANISM="Chattonella subsalsa, Strain CCMP2191" /LENGTH=494 /DNA_ID=CAMNT_0005584749 /DNA_START=196 /DNA_END=1680 /DNA_ORIENTATION=-
MGIRTWWRERRSRRKETKLNKVKWLEIKEKGAIKTDKGKKKNKKTSIGTLSDLAFVSGLRGVDKCDIRGTTFETLATNKNIPNHPVIEVLRQRQQQGYKPSDYSDGYKVGLCIEGGGMRGCVTAGMAACITDLGLVDCFDAFYGSSAGSLIGAYIIGQQEGMPRYGCSLYYDLLTGKERHFIDTRYFLRTLGFGLFYNPGGIRELFKDRLGKPVLKLEYLLHDVVQKIRPLDFEKFWKNQQKQPLNIIASNVETQTSVAMTSAKGNWDSIETMTQCMRASMNLPGIAGPPLSIPTVCDGQPLVDSQLFEPIPYRSAISDGCTHLVVLRSRPDGLNVCGSKSALERLIMRRYFRRKNRLPSMYKYMKALGHKEIYSEDMLILNEAASLWESTSQEKEQPQILPISLQQGIDEIGRLERGREAIFEGVRNGFVHAHEILKAVKCGPSEEYTVDLEKLSDGWSAAKRVFPDDILNSKCDPIVGCPDEEILEKASFRP